MVLKFPGRSRYPVQGLRFQVVMEFERDQIHSLDAISGLVRKVLECEGFTECPVTTTHYVRHRKFVTRYVTSARGFRLGIKHHPPFMKSDPNRFRFLSVSHSGNGIEVLRNYADVLVSAGIPSMIVRDKVGSKYKLWVLIAYDPRGEWVQEWNPYVNVRKSPDTIKRNHESNNPGRKSHQGSKRTKAGVSDRGRTEG